MSDKQLLGRKYLVDAPNRDTLEAWQDEFEVFGALTGHGPAFYQSMLKTIGETCDAPFMDWWETLAHTATKCILAPVDMASAADAGTSAYLG